MAASRHDIATLEGQLAKVAVRIPVDDIKFHVLGKGLHVETFSLQSCIITVHHPIQMCDLQDSQLATNHLNAVYQRLQDKIKQLDDDPALLSHEEIEMNVARTLSRDSLLEYLRGIEALPGSFPQEELATSAQRRRFQIVEMPRRQSRRISIGNDARGFHDELMLPNSLGEFKISHPLMPEDVRMAIGEFDLRRQLQMVSKILTATQRRLYADMLGSDGQKSETLNLARWQSIEVLWQVYQKVFDLRAEQDVIRYVENQLSATTESQEYPSSSSATDQEFFMIPIDGPVAFSSPLRQRTITSSPTGESMIAKNEALTSRDGSTGAIPVSEVSVASSTSGSWKNPTASVRHDNSSNASIETFHSVVEPVGERDNAMQPSEDGIDSWSIGSMVTQHHEEVQDLVREESGPDTALDHVEGSQPRNEESVDLSSDRPPSPSVVRPVWWKHASMERKIGPSLEMKAKAPQTASKPPFDKALEIDEQAKATIEAKTKRMPTKLQKGAKKSHSLLRNMFKKNKSKDEKSSEAPKSSNTSFAEAVTTVETVGDFLHPAGETKIGGEVPMTSIPEPATTVADLFPSRRSTIKWKEKITTDAKVSGRSFSPARSPPPIPSPPPFRSSSL